MAFKDASGFSYRDLLYLICYSNLFEMTSCIEHSIVNCIRHVIKLVFMNHVSPALRVCFFFDGLVALFLVIQEKWLLWLYEDTDEYIFKTMKLPSFMKKYISGFLTKKTLKSKLPQKYAYLLFLRFCWWFRSLVPANLRQLLDDWLLVTACVLDSTTKTREEIADIYIRCQRSIKLSLF